MSKIENRLCELALQIALDAHRGTEDKFGKPYVFHVLRVGLEGATVAEQAAGFLHDVVEDTSLTLDDLARRGIPLPVLQIVDRLTRRDNETYEEYVLRAAAHPVARKVKRLDLLDNMDAARQVEQTPAHHERLSRYTRALAVIDEMENAGLSDGVDGMS